MLLETNIIQVLYYIPIYINLLSYMSYMSICIDFSISMSSICIIYSFAIEKLTLIGNLLFDQITSR